MIRDRPRDDAESIRREVAAHRQPGDIVIASLHWGGNWGYMVADEQRELAHRLIDDAGVDIVHGHSSHHPRHIEVHRGRLIIYGCGDLLNDYEGIAGHDEYRPDLSLLYLVALDSPGGELAEVEMHAMRIERMSLRRASREDAEWLADAVAGPDDHPGAGIELTRQGTLMLRAAAARRYVQ